MYHKATLLTTMKLKYSTQVVKLKRNAFMIEERSETTTKNLLNSLGKDFKLFKKIEFIISFKKVALLKNQANTRLQDDLEFLFHKSKDTLSIKTRLEQEKVKEKLGTTSPQF